MAVVANALNVSGANNESEEKDDKPHCFSIVPAGHIGGGFSFLHDPAELRNNCRLTKDRHTAGMVSTAEQHSKISKRYDKLADDESMSPEQRAKFARSSNCHRILARIQQTQAIRDQVIQPSSLALSAAA